MQRISRAVVLVAAIAASASAPPADAARGRTESSRAAPMAARLPQPKFVENAGQWGEDVAFAARGLRRDALFRAGSLSLVERDGAAVTLSFPGEAAPRGEAEGHARFHWFRGRDAASHPMHVRTFGAVVYEDAWPGVALRFDARPAAMEYTLDVAPGADVTLARLRVEGAARVEVRADGGLALVTSAGTQTHSAPLAWQETHGVRTPVRVAFDVDETADGAWSVGFDVGAYDRARPLRIDPVFEFTTHPTGLSGSDQFEGIGADAQGSVYVVGRAGTPGAVPAGVPSVQPTTRSFYDAFVAKLDRDGEVVYATFLGGSATIEYEEYEYAIGVAVDGDGEAIVGGYTYSDDFPMVAGPSNVAGQQATTFAAKLSSDGSALRFSGFIEGTSFGNGAGLPRVGVATDAQGSAYLAGFTYGEVPVTRSLGTPSGPKPYAWVAKVLPSGGLGYLLSLQGNAGSYAQRANDVAVGPDGSAYVCGFTSGAGSLPAAGATTPYRGGGRDAFVAKVNPAGTALDYVAYVGGDQDDWGETIAVDGAGAAYLLGSSSSSLASFPRDQHRTGDAYYAKLAPDGQSVEFAGSLRLLGMLRSSIGLDPSGRVYVAGGSEVHRIAADGAALETLSGTYTEAPIAIVSDVEFWKLDGKTVTHVLDTATGVPTGVAAQALTPRSARVAWQSPAGTTTFVLQRSEAGGPFVDVAATGAVTLSFEDQGLEPDTEYSYRVIARAGLSASAPSAAVNVRTPPTLLVRVRRASLVDRVEPLRDDVRLLLSLRRAQRGSAPAFDPAQDRVRLAIGEDLVLSISAGDPAWLPRGTRWTWTGPLGAGTATLRIDPARRRATLRVHGIALPGVPASGDRVSLRIGEDAGSDAAGWQRSTRVVVK